MSSMVTLNELQRCTIYVGDKTAGHKLQISGLYGSVLRKKGCWSPAVVCVREGTSKADLSRFEKLIRWGGLVVGTKTDPVATATERRTLQKLLTILDTGNHPLHTALSSQRSLVSRSPLLLNCRTLKELSFSTPH